MEPVAEQFESGPEQEGKSRERTRKWRLRLKMRSSKESEKKSFQPRAGRDPGS